MQTETDIQRRRDGYVRLLYPLALVGIAGSIAVHIASWFGTAIADIVGWPLHIAALLCGFLIIVVVKFTHGFAFKSEVDATAYFPFLESRRGLPVRWIAQGYYLYMFIMTILEPEDYFWRMASMIWFVFFGSGLLISNKFSNTTSPDSAVAE